MRTAEMEVPIAVFGDFAEGLIESGIENSITGKTDEGHIIIELVYEKSESDEVDELEAHLEELIKNNED